MDFSLTAVIVLHPATNKKAHIKVCFTPSVRPFAEEETKCQEILGRYLLVVWDVSANCLSNGFHLAYQLGKSFWLQGLTAV